MYSCLNVMLNWGDLGINVLINTITAGDLEACFLSILTTVWFSMWNNILLLANMEPQIFMATITWNRSTCHVHCTCSQSNLNQWCGHLPKAFLFWRNIPNPPNVSPEISLNSYNSVTGHLKPVGKESRIMIIVKKS